MTAVALYHRLERLLSPFFFGPSPSLGGLSLQAAARMTEQTK
jgi:hypothetical protein